MMRSVLLLLGLCEVLAGCSLGGASGAMSSGRHTHSEPARQVAPAWAAYQVRRMHPKRGIGFMDIRCDIRKRSVVCTGYLSYGTPGTRVPQYFRIQRHDGSPRLVPYCPPPVGDALMADRIFCSE